MIVALVAKCSLAAAAVQRRERRDWLGKTKGPTQTSGYAPLSEHAGHTVLLAYFATF